MARKKHDDEDEDAGEPERAVSADAWAAAARERDEDAALRPRSFAEFVGQRKIAENMAVYVQAARKRGDALDHVLLSGPPGLGKTTLAYLLAHEMGTEVRVTSGPALERKGDLAGLLTSLGRGDVLFIDEIHRLQPVIEESLYPAMEDFRIELLTGTGAGARAINLPIERFTLVGATTRTGQLGSPLLDRVRHPRVVRVLFARGADHDREALGAAARHRDRRRGRRRDRPPRARHAARRQPPACAGSATSPRCAATAASRATGRSSRSSGWRSTRSGSTPAIARSWRRS